MNFSVWLLNNKSYTITTKQIFTTPLRNYNKLMKKYVPTQEIGKGGYGTVYKAKNVNDGTIVAIKRIQLSENEEGIKNSTLREIAVAKAMNHPNLVKLIEVIPDQKENVVYCVMEFCPMDLRSFIR